ncbi:ABC transporter ATP-binding protein [Microbacterium gilvum]|uniref:ABC transporter domain-containing protein n=1 Tax=Microbacterium gilvum TaxID=1336204 RepID=A0ABP9A4W5_9MICO
MTAAIETHGLQKRYGRRTALHALDLAVRPGTVFGLIGPNGAGKTTTLRILLDVIRPSGGEVRVLGEDPRRGGPALRKRIGYVPGELRLDSRTTGRGLLDFYARVSGPSPKGRADELADRLGLDLSRRVRTLSKGNKQKLGLVQAFLHEPELLILDEPTSGLDPLVQRTFIELVREARDRGQTVLLSSHVLSEIQQTADEVAVLSEGRVVASGDVASLRLGAVRRIRAGIADTSAEDVATALRALRLHDLDVAGGTDQVRVSATAEGEIDAVVKVLAGFPLVDLTVEEPDLEESVLRLYGAERHHADDAADDSTARTDEADAAAVADDAGAADADEADADEADADEADADEADADEASTGQADEAHADEANVSRAGDVHDEPPTGAAADAQTPRAFRSNFVDPPAPQVDAETPSVAVEAEAGTPTPPEESPTDGTLPDSVRADDERGTPAEEADRDEAAAPEWPPDPEDLLAAPVVPSTRPAHARGTFTPVSAASPRSGAAIDLKTAEVRRPGDRAGGEDAREDGRRLAEPAASEPEPSEPAPSEPEPSRPLLRRDLRGRPPTGVLPVAGGVQHEPGAAR